MSPGLNVAGLRLIQIPIPLPGPPSTSSNTEPGCSLVFISVTNWRQSGPRVVSLIPESTGKTGAGSNQIWIEML